MNKSENNLLSSSSFSSSLISNKFLLLPLNKQSHNLFEFIGVLKYLLINIFSKYYFILFFSFSKSLYFDLVICSLLEFPFKGVT